MNYPQIENLARSLGYQAVFFPVVGYDNYIILLPSPLMGAMAQLKRPKVNQTMFKTYLMQLEQAKEKLDNDIDRTKKDIIELDNNIEKKRIREQQDALDNEASQPDDLQDYKDNEINQMK